MRNGSVTTWDDETIDDNLGEFPSEIKVCADFDIDKTTVKLSNFVNAMKRASYHSIAVLVLYFRVRSQRMKHYDNAFLADSLPHNVHDGFAVGERRWEVVVLTVDCAVFIRDFEIIIIIERSLFTKSEGWVDAVVEIVCCSRSYITMVASHCVFRLDVDVALPRVVKALLYPSRREGCFEFCGDL